MIPTVLQYMDFLKIKINVLKDIYKNTVDQQDALEKKDHELLGKLLKIRQAHIDYFGQIMKHSSEYDHAEKNKETEKWEQVVKYLLQEVIKNNDANMKSLEHQKDDIAGTIKHINLGKHAIQNGYFKKMPQRYGYFIDKKINDRFKIGMKSYKEEKRKK